MIKVQRYCVVAVFIGRAFILQCDRISTTFFFPNISHFNNDCVIYYIVYKVFS